MMYLNNFNTAINFILENLNQFPTLLMKISKSRILREYLKILNATI
jgi:hypothetical protein